MTQFKIECSDEMMEKIEAIAFSETQIEVGGFLIGTYDENGAVVTDVLPARHSVGRSTQLTFTHETWNALYAELKETGGALVGWFHSHPNFGVFLSEHDQFIQQNFFGADGNITIVVDPIRGRRGWFYSHEGKIKKYEKEEDTTRERLGVSATNPDENIEAIMGTNNSGVTTTKVVLISAVMSLLGGFLGFALSVTTGGNSSLSSEVAQLRAEVAFLSGADIASAPKAIATNAPKPKATAPKATAKATTKSTAKPAGKAAAGNKASDTPTATTLNSSSVIPGKACKKGAVDPANKYVCKVKPKSNPVVYVWTTKGNTVINTDPKTEVKTDPKTEVKTETKADTQAPASSSGTEAKP